MEYWLCVASARTWATVRDQRIWGAPKGTHNLNAVSKIHPGDWLAFYLRSPIRQIVGLYKATSNMFIQESKEPFNDWRTYMHRIRIEPLSKETRELERSIPLDTIMGRLSKLQNRYQLFGRSVIPLTEDDYWVICSLAGVSIPKV